MEVTCRDGSKHAARFIVLAMPPNLIGRLTFAPQLPSHRLQLHDRMPLGACIKAIMFYERPFWRDAGRVGAPVCQVMWWLCAYNILLCLPTCCVGMRTTQGATTHH